MSKRLKASDFSVPSRDSVPTEPISEPIKKKKKQKTLLGNTCTDGWPDQFIKLDKIYKVGG